MGGSSSDFFELNYVPTVAPAYWEEVREFVEDVVGRVRGSTPYSDTDLALSVGRLALWCWQDAGLDLDAELVFHRAIIDRFSRAGLPAFNEAARGNIRSQLLRVAEAVLDPALVPRRLTPMRAADPSRPYLEREVIALQAWANSQSTEARRDNANVLLALGLGAGLSASEIGNLNVRDLCAHDAGVDVEILGPRARQVPVLDYWTGVLRERIAQLPGDRFAFREGHTSNYDNLISNFVSRSRSEGVLPQTQRMRATWVVHHLQNGVPLAQLLRASGVESLDALNRYMRFVANDGYGSDGSLLRR
jgi:integrase